ncbi:unnamed protein product, partial [Brenthis ino]
MSWTNDVVLEFLEHYRTEQLIWDPKHPLHRNRSEVNDAWLRIQNSLSIHSSITDLKRKKESLMTSFRLHMNRKKKSSNDYRTTWFAFPLMESFLGGKYECDSSVQMDHEYDSNNSYQNTTLKQLNVKRKLKKNGAETTYGKTEAVEAVDFLKNATDFKKDRDEYDLFGQLLAKKLRKLDERQRDIAMHEIDNIMFNAKMQSVTEVQPRSYSSSPPPPGPVKIKSPMYIVQQHGPFEEDNIPYPEHQQT